MKKIIKKWKLFYKKGIAGLLILSLTSLSMAGCGKTMGIDSGASVDRISKVSALSKDKQQLISKIAANVRAKRAAGFLAQIPAELYKMPANPNSAANEVSASDNESVGQKLEEFYTEPEKALTEMAGEEKGQEQLELVDAIYSEQTADIVADKMGQLDLKMKEQYVSNLEKMADSSSEIQAQFVAQGIIDSKTKKLDLSKIKLNFSEPLKSANAGVNWNSINTYYGYCALALAGEVVWAFTPAFNGWNGWVIWIKIAAIATTLAGVGLMTYQVANVWGLKFGSYSVTKVVNDLGGTSEALKKISMIISATAIPVGFAAIYLRGEMKWLFSELSKIYNNYIKPVIDYCKVNNGNGINIIKLPF